MPLFARPSIPRVKPDQKDNIVSYNLLQINTTFRGQKPQQISRLISPPVARGGSTLAAEKFFAEILMSESRHSGAAVAVGRVLPDPALIEEHEGGGDDVYQF